MLKGYAVLEKFGTQDLKYQFKAELFFIPLQLQSGLKSSKQGENRIGSLGNSGVSRVAKGAVAHGGHFGRVFNRLANSPKLRRFTSRGGSRLPQGIQTLEQIGMWSYNQTTRSTYPGTSTASGTNKNWLNLFLVPKSFRLNSLIRNK